MLKTVSIILLVLLGALLLMASRQPDAFAIERAVVIAAPAEVGVECLEHYNLKKKMYVCMGV